MGEVIESHIVLEYINYGTKLFQKYIWIYWFFFTECDSDDNLGMKSTSMGEEFRSTEGNLIPSWLYLYVFLKFLPLSLHPSYHWV